MATLLRHVTCGVLGLVALLLSGNHVSAQNAANADAAYNGYLSAFLVQSNGQAYFCNSLTDRTVAYMWGQAMMIAVVEDSYDRSPSSAKSALISTLLNTFMTNNNGSDWSWDSWNDDIAWATMCFIRGYQITGNTTYLNAATQNWNMAWNRGWDGTVGGGIWENQDKFTKTTLANATFIISGCAIYKATNDSGYLTKCQQIYAWMRPALFTPGTGQVNEALTSSGALQSSDNMYNSGIFLNAANALYKVTTGSNYFSDAQTAANRVVNNNLWYMNGSGIISYTGNNGFWADQFVRALANFARQNNLWNQYSPWLQKQATAAWNSRRTDHNITWNNWTAGTGDPSYAMDDMGAVVLQQVSQTDPRSGPHYITSANTGLVVDNGSTSAQGAGVIQWAWNAGSAQQWNFTQNSDTSWNISCQYGGQVLDDPGYSTVNGTQIIQWGEGYGTNQKWWVDVQSDGTYKIWNQSSQLALDNDNSGANKTPLVQWTWNGGANQRWLLK